LGLFRFRCGAGGGLRLVSDRRIAILVDGGFFLKRLPGVVAAAEPLDAGAVVEKLRQLCRSDATTLSGTDGKRWQDHIYRIFFRLRRERKVALRLGKVVREGDWIPPSDKTRRILATKAWLAALDFAAIADGGDLHLTAEQVAQAALLKQRWQEITPANVRLLLRQKGVDMRIGLDIASITLKRQANTIVLVAGDSDFVPAAKLARREGVEFILDPLWQQVNEDLFEHIDGLQSGLPKPRRRAASAQLAEGA